MGVPRQASATLYICNSVDYVDKPLLTQVKGLVK